jgi:ParB/RepB/Spo0J family partition protein
VTTTFGAQLDLEIPAATMAYEVKYVEHAAVKPDPTQPRSHPDDELKASIRSKGILQPITVRPHPENFAEWMIVDGERRWRGAQGILEHVPVIVREDLGDRAERLETQLTANVGKPLTPIEEARAYAELMPAHGTVASLARALGRPERSVGERLQLLELGPWVELIADGRVPVSIAVKHLIPLRGCPDAVHAHALELALKSYHAEKNPEPGQALFSASDFGRVVQEAYRGSMYPLVKSKASYDQRPAFDTRKHDQECECGRVQFEMSYGAKRACCGNPAWWKPKHRAAQKADTQAKPKTKSAPSKTRERRWWVPEGAKQVKANGYEEPRGYVRLTDYNRRWSARDLACDPSGVSFPAEDLAVVTSSYGEPYVAVRENSPAIVAARGRWKERWDGRRKGLVEALRRQVKEKGSAYRVSGPGLSELLARLGDAYAERTHVVDAAEASGAIDEKTAGAKDDLLAKEVAYRKWLGGLSEKEIAATATTLAYLCGTRTTPPTARAEDERRKADEEITRKPVPWGKEPKGATAKRKTKKGKDKPPPDESIEEDLDNEELEDE